MDPEMKLFLVIGAGVRISRKFIHKVFYVYLFANQVDDCYFALFQEVLRSSVCFSL